MKTYVIYNVNTFEFHSDYDWFRDVVAKLDNLRPDYDWINITHPAHNETLQQILINEEIKWNSSQH